MHNNLILDLETKQTFSDVGGHHNAHNLGVSMVGVYSYRRDQFRAFREGELDELLPWMQDADAVVGFNSKKFDFTVLQPYYPKFNLLSLPHVDILEDVVFALGHRLKLESIAQTTLGRGKSGDGLDAIRYFRENNWSALEQYCLDDVKITKELYDYGVSHGYLWYLNNGVKDKIIVKWGAGDTVEDIVNRAAVQGRQLEVEYLEDDGKSTTRKIDIQRIDGNKIRAYCHLRKALRVFDLSKITKAVETGPMASFQKPLL